MENRRFGDHQGTPSDVLKKTKFLIISAARTLKLILIWPNFIFILNCQVLFYGEHVLTPQAVCFLFAFFWEHFSLPEVFFTRGLNAIYLV